MTTSMQSSLRTYLDERRTLIDEALDRHLPAGTTPPAVIHEAMRYSVLAGGKRIRPILAIAAAETCGSDSGPLLKAFAALELIHTYSLVHDDLPAIDNDDLRRGRKTAHVVFGDAMAILTGDALLTEAFAWLSEPIPAVPPARQLAAISTVSTAIDSRGMIGGQVADIESERALQFASNSSQLLETLHFIHRNKTGRLLTASVLLGGLLGNATDAVLASLRHFGEAIGLAFQIVDDLLDGEETAETLGKTAGKDLAQGKLTYPALLGADEARRRVQELLDSAIGHAGMIGGPVNYLAHLARYICERRS